MENAERGNAGMENSGRGGQAETVSVSDVCSVAEVCKAVGISRMTLYKRIRQKHIRPLPRDIDKDGLKLWFNRADMIRLAEIEPILYPRRCTIHERTMHERTMHERTMPE